MTIVVCEVEETVDAAIYGCGEMLRNDFPSVVTLDEEETTFITSVCLSLIEMFILTGIFLHITVGIKSPVAL